MRTTDALEFIEVDGRALIVGFKVMGTGEGSGVSVEMEIWQFWEVREGVPFGVREFPDRRAAVEASAAGEQAEGKA